MSEARGAPPADQGRLWLALFLVALAQTGILAFLVADRVRLLRTGREITLPVRPVDPRDLFRGEYARLGYDINTLPGGLLQGPAPGANAAFFVVLERRDETWQPVEISSSKPQEPAPDRIVLKARAAQGWPLSAWHSSQRVRYGIERYFLPEGEGRRLESLAGDKKLAALIAVDGGGNAAIKGLLIDGVLTYQEPLF
jgi:uncharacterized membrane-anchored protein